MSERMRFFKLRTLNLDLEKKTLTVNGKTVPFEGITDFSLTTGAHGEWLLMAKRDITLDFYEECPERNSEG